MSAESPFFWRTGQLSAITKALGRTQTAPKTEPVPLTYPKKPAHALRKSTGNTFDGAGGQIKPCKPAAVYKKNGLVAPDNNGFSIPPREQAQADADRRDALRRGGI